MFYMPTKDEWSKYKRFLGEEAMMVDVEDEGSGTNEKSNYWLLISYMPAIKLYLTEPDLSWCADADSANRFETKIDVGSSYFVMEKCVLGPISNYSAASLDRRVAMFVQSFATEVANGLRWILQIYKTTDVIQQRDMLGKDVLVAKNMHNKVSFSSYAPVKLITELNDRNHCNEMIECVESNGQSFSYVQSFGNTPGTSAPVGDLGQFTRPHLGAASIVGPCTGDSSARPFVNDIYAMSPENLKRMRECFLANVDYNINANFSGIIRPASGVEPNSPMTCGRPQRPTRPVPHQQGASHATPRESDMRQSYSGGLQMTRTEEPRADAHMHLMDSYNGPPQSFSQPAPDVFMSRCELEEDE